MVEETPGKPKNVVVVDADNPLVEFHGEFFWREDHDEIVAGARDEAYRQGYNQGRFDASQSASRQQEVVLRYRPSFLMRLRRWVLGAVALVGFVVLLVAVILE